MFESQSDITRAPGPAGDGLAVFTNHGNLPSRLVVVDHQVPAVAPDGEGRAGLRPDEDVQRVPDAGVEPGCAGGVGVPDQEVGGLVRDDGQQVAVLVPAEAGAHPGQSELLHQVGMSGEQISQISQISQSNIYLLAGSQISM